MRPSRPKCLRGRSGTQRICATTGSWRCATARSSAGSRSCRFRRAYVGEEARGEGAGSALLTTLIDSSERAGIWTLQTGVFPENDVSLRLLQRFGFRVVGTRERIGRLHGVWRDVVLVERRSEVIS